MLRILIFMNALFCICSPALAENQVPTSDQSEIIVYGRAIDQVGIATSGSEGVVGYSDFENRPISRVGELAENVPGLIATQHSGSGKANQYFLRGFNLDHGTDLAGFVDGAPINMRSHGHGQGYLDLNFLIPELIERIDYSKGPYHAADGDFSSAGSMRFITKSSFERPIAEITLGSFNYLRGLMAQSADVGSGKLLGALEGTASDGPWVLNEHQRKLNSFVKFSLANWSLGLAGYSNSWVSTDQVPERAILSGQIPRNGYIDPNLGGSAGRLALTFSGNFGATQVAAYAIGSRLDLKSNFTYFLNDPVLGDEFKQVDRRGVFGGSIKHEFKVDNATLRVGADARWDRIGKVGLYNTIAGKAVGAVREDRVNEVGGGLFGDAEFTIASNLRISLGVRGDMIFYDVRSDLLQNSGNGSSAILTPKAALAWRVRDGVELYVNYGEGFHSNDVRGAVIQLNPSTQEAAAKVPIFARSKGAELGARVEGAKVTASLVGYWLDLASELVFVGDEGTTEPNAASRRFGSELAVFWKPTASLTIDGTASWTHARFKALVDFNNEIPGATPFVLGGGLSAKLSPELTITARLRHFAGAPLIEDGSKRSKATTLFNLGAYWDVGKWRVGIDLLNALNSKDPDISYWYASRLVNEPLAGVEDRHFHPVEPRQIRLSLRVGL